MLNNMIKVTPRFFSQALTMQMDRLSVYDAICWFIFPNYIILTIKSLTLVNSSETIGLSDAFLAIHLLPSSPSWCQCLIFMCGRCKCIPHLHLLLVHDVLDRDYFLVVLTLILDFRRKFKIVTASSIYNVKMSFIS